MSQDPKNIQELLTSLDKEGVSAVIESLSQAQNPASVLQLIGDTVKALYWKRKDLPHVVALGNGALSAGLALVNGDREIGARYEFLSAVKAIAYNIGSYTWPGWAERGITPTTTDLTIGLDAALLNLRLAQELDKGLLPLARAHWLVGAQYISANDLPAARRHFQEAAVFAGRAENAGEQHLGQAFAGLVGAALADGGDKGRAESRQALRLALDALAGIPDGEGFIEQVRTAAEVFGWTEMFPASK